MTVYILKGAPSILFVHSYIYLFNLLIHYLSSPLLLPRALGAKSTRGTLSKDTGTCIYVLTYVRVSKVMIRNDHARFHFDGTVERRPTMRRELKLTRFSFNDDDNITMIIIVMIVIIIIFATTRTNDVIATITSFIAGNFSDFLLFFSLLLLFFFFLEKGRVKIIAVKLVPLPHITKIASREGRLFFPFFIIFPFPFYLSCKSFSSCCFY